ncbi:MAG: DUF4168 domain-containing protein [Rhodospirillales bacterium]|nr:DUF4168 domain-containing protein [Rhodospirillales bacterium]
MSRTIANKITALCLVLFFGAALAGVTGGTAHAQAAATTNFSDAKLSSFIDAAKKIDGLIVDWNPKIAAAKTPEDKQKVMAEAEAEAIKAIEKTKGITVDEYRQIGEAARKDPALAARLDKMYQAR